MKMSSLIIVKWCSCYDWALISFDPYQGFSLLLPGTIIDEETGSEKWSSLP